MIRFLLTLCLVSCVDLEAPVLGELRTYETTVTCSEPTVQTFDRCTVDVQATLDELAAAFLALETPCTMVARCLDRGPLPTPCFIE